MRSRSGTPTDAEIDGAAQALFNADIRIDPPSEPVSWEALGPFERESYLTRAEAVLIHFLNHDGRGGGFAVLNLPDTTVCTGAPSPWKSPTEIST
jgi:hypothetical protein